MIAANRYLEHACSAKTARLMTNDILMERVVLHSAAVEHLREIIKQLVVLEWVELAQRQALDAGRTRMGKHTHSTRKTVLQLICGPQSLAASSGAASVNPASLRRMSSSNSFQSPTSDSFWRVA
jgi:hypothetical protein